MQDHTLRLAAILRCIGHIALALAAAIPAGHQSAGVVNAVGSLLLAAAHALDGR